MAYTAAVRYCTELIIGSTPHDLEGMSLRLGRSADMMYRYTVSSLLQNLVVMSEANVRRVRGTDGRFLRFREVDERMEADTDKVVPSPCCCWGSCPHGHSIS